MDGLETGWTEAHFIEPAGLRKDEQRHLAKVKVVGSNAVFALELPGGGVLSRQSPLE